MVNNCRIQDELLYVHTCKDYNSEFIFQNENYSPIRNSLALLISRDISQSVKKTSKSDHMYTIKWIR